MIHADQVLEDEHLVATVCDALAKRHPKVAAAAGKAPPAEVVLRLLILNSPQWSYCVLEREVRAKSGVPRLHAASAGAKMPDAKTMGRWGLALGPQVIKQIHQKNCPNSPSQRSDARPQNAGGHHGDGDQYSLSDRLKLAGDGVRVLIRTMKKITKIAGEAGANCENRSRSVKLRALEIARAARAKGKQSQGKLERRTANCSIRPAGWWEQAKAVLQRDRRRSEACSERSQNSWRSKAAPGARCDGAARQAGDETDQSAHLPWPIRAPKANSSACSSRRRNHSQRQAGKPNEFGKMVETAGAENQIVIDYEVYAQRPSDSDLLIAAIERIKQCWDATPRPGGGRRRIHSAISRSESLGR